MAYPILIAVCAGLLYASGASVVKEAKALPHQTVKALKFVGKTVTRPFRHK
jgi:hypothetical protein